MEISIHFYKSKFSIESLQLYLTKLLSKAPSRLVKVVPRARHSLVISIPFNPLNSPRDDGEGRNRSKLILKSDKLNAP